MTIPSDIPTEPDKSRQPLVLAGIIIAFSIYLFGSSILIFLLKPAHLSGEGLFFISRIFCWVCLLAMYVYAVKVEKQPFLLWTEKKYSFGYYLLLVIAVLLMLLAGMLVLSGIELSLGLLKKSAKLNDMLSILRQSRWLVVFTCLTAGVTEELVFRGYLVPRLQLFSKSHYPPLIISSVLFGAVHIGYGNIAQVVGPTFIGYIFALYYHKYRSINVLIVCHFLWDYFTLHNMIR